MSKVDLLLKGINASCNLSYLEDIYDLYDFIPNGDLRALLSSIHTSLNNWFSAMNDNAT